MNSNTQYSIRAQRKFILLSLIGFIIFLMPVPDPSSESFTLLIGIISTAFHNMLGSLAQDLIILMMVVSLAGTFVATFILPKKLDKENSFYKLFYAKGLNLVGRIIGAILLIMTAYEVGPGWLLNSNVGGTALMISIIVGIELIPAIFLMPLLIDFGLMEFLGTLVNRFVRPLFRLPGRSSVDLLASWVGMVEMGLIVTEEQYAEGYYTNREAQSIATCFTATGVAFWLVCAETTGISGYFVPFFLAIFTVGILQAFIAVRIPPLSKLPDEYYVKNENNLDPSNKKPDSQSNFSYAVELGSTRANGSPTAKELVEKSTFMNLSILLTLVPIVMIIGVIALAIVEYSPVLDILGYPFTALLTLLNVPDAAIAGPAIVSGFFDMFLPMILVAEAASIQMRFIVTVVGLTQIVFLSEVIAYLMNSRIPIKFSHMVLIFLQRTVIAILYLVPFTYLFGIVG